MNERNEQIEPRAEEENGESRIPEDVLLVLPVRNLIVFPGAVTQVALGREISIAAAQEAVKNDRKLGLVLQRDPAVDEPGPEDLYKVGTVVSVVRYITAPNGMHHLICQGEERFRVLDFVPGLPFMAARFDTIPEPKGTSPEAEALANHVKQKAGELIQLLPQVPPELPTALQSIESPGLLADLVAGLIDIKPAEKQFILETVEVRERLERLAEFLTHRLKVLKLSKEIDEQTQDKIDERQREYLLREQLKTIQKELGEDEGAPEAEEIERAIDEAGMPPEAEKQARKELKRLKAMPEAAAEHSMIRTYLDWLVSVPWSKEDEENIDIARAREILDEDHYGLDKVKRRILEYLAVRKLNPTGRSPILCFVGPPGVGKTSLGQSIARALGLEFVRASLGGVHDEAEIRGHRRTYIGSMPGSVVQSIVKAGTRNPVFMLDEMDKLGVGFHGDPSSALLEVLDPEQNSTFKDHYLDVPFDLSKVLFVGTANVLDNIPGPLRDRMEVIELPGYTQEDKLEIARRYLVGRQLEANGLTAEQAAIDDEAIEKLIDGYTREAGVRNLERQIGAVLRHAAMKITEGTADSVHVTAEDLQSIIGAPKFESEVALRTSVPGVATGLAWTPVGGDILFIEASRIPGQGKLILTGQLGDVMKESAQAALSLNKSRVDRLDAAAKAFEENDVHIHVPAGAIPKDGPSAGVAMFVALASLLSGRNVRKDVAMTGEISLRGLVLPVGGIKEKVLAALRAGIHTVLLPARNRKDLEDVPESARDRLEFIWLENVDQALDAALEPEGAEDKPQAA
ncbi:endopeptidase La [Lentisalinibacter salinarum]|uniref:endopeptidase La n=1 Tax=Lentisalinibacter salinarum TaxID=2992239 RepID=UPI00386DFF1D